MDQSSVQDIENLRQWKHFQGVDGIPFRTRNEGVPNYKKDDPEHRQPKTVADMHVKQFNLKDKGELEECERVLDKCAKGGAYLSQKEIQFDAKISGWRVFLIWGDLFLEDPVEAAINDEKDKQTFS